MRMRLRLRSLLGCDMWVALSRDKGGRASAAVLGPKCCCATKFINMAAPP